MNKPKKYLPSNGSEGIIFMYQFCFQCSKEKRCPILTKTMIGEQVDQWIYNENDIPVCTSFKMIGTSNQKRPKNLPTLF